VPQSRGGEEGRAARAAILAKLEATLAHGSKAVIRNKGFARFGAGTVQSLAKRASTARTARWRASI